MQHLVCSLIFKAFSMVLRVQGTICSVLVCSLQCAVSDMIFPVPGTMCSVPLIKRHVIVSPPSQGADSPVAAAKGCLSALSDVPYKAVKTCAWVGLNTLYCSTFICSK